MRRHSSQSDTEWAADLSLRNCNGRRIMKGWRWEG